MFTHVRIPAPGHTRLMWGFLQGWFAAVRGEPCDPPTVFVTAEARHGWIDGWCIASDQRLRGVAIDDVAEASDVCHLYLNHTLTPRGAMS